MMGAEFLLLIATIVIAVSAVRWYYLHR